MSAEFEKLAMEFINREENLELLRPFPITVGFGANQKTHKFDLGSEYPKTLIECKNHTWTKSGNTPSAKISIWNEAMLYFTVAPLTYRKILFVKKSTVDGRSLAHYYVSSYSHLIPPGVEIWEFDTEKLTGSCIFPSSKRKQPIEASRSSKQIKPKSKVISKAKMGSVDDFKTAIEGLFENGQKESRKTITIKAGNLHESVLGSRSTPARMPSCCSAMYSFLDSKDRIIYKPPKGKGANLEIEYKLPR